MNIRKLSRRSFARAVRLGHGSAVLHLKKFGDQGLEDVITSAMLTSYVYDWQIEGSRQFWIFSLIVATQRPHHYAKQFLEKARVHLACGDDRTQQILLCRQFFEIGYTEALDLAMEMYPALLASNPDRAQCGVVFVDMAGEAGLQFAAQNICDTPKQIDSWQCSSVYGRAEDLLDYPSELKDMKDIKTKTESNRRFFEAVEEYKRSDEAPKGSARSKIERPDWPTMLEMIKRKDFAPSAMKYRQFGRHLTTQEVQQVYELLLTTKDAWEQLCFLRIFKAQKLPGVTADLLLLLFSKEKYLARAAADAFSSTKNCLTRSLALELLESKKQKEIALAVDLLESNYVAGDAVAIQKAMRKLKDADRLHYAGMSIQTIAESHRDRGLENLLIWLYENNPESWCREKIFNKMVEWEICPADLKYEAQWDCSEELQMAARRLSSEVKFSDAR